MSSFDFFLYRKGESIFSPSPSHLNIQVLVSLLHFFVLLHVLSYGLEGGVELLGADVLLLVEVELPSLLVLRVDIN